MLVDGLSQISCDRYYIDRPGPVYQVKYCRVVRLTRLASYRHQTGTNNLISVDRKELAERPKH